MAAKNKTNQKPVAAPAKPEKSSKKTVHAGTTDLFNQPFWSQHWVPALILMALAFGLYGMAIRFGYVLDDEMVIQKNAYVQEGWAGIRKIFGADSFMGYFQDREKLYLLEGGRYRPLSLATFAAEIGIFGKGNANLAHYSHFINILLYGLTGILLYRILLGLMPLRAGSRWYFSAAFIGALLFMAHPLHSEVVANIKGRDEILALLGGLLALYANLKYFDTEKWHWLVLSGLYLLLGMLAKENALTFLAVIPLTAWWFAKAPAGRAVLAATPLMAATFIFVVIRYNALGFMLDHGKAVSDIMNDPFIQMNIGQKFATIFLTLGWYIKLLFVPHPLTHDYYPYHVPKVGWDDWRALLSLVAYLAMGVWAVLKMRSKKIPAFAILYWLITLSIVSNLVVSVGSFMNERFAYMPSVGFALLGGWFLARWIPEKVKETPDHFNFISGAVLLGVLGVFAWRTLTRVPDWKDAASLNEAAIKVSYNSARSHCFYVTSMYQEKYLKTKDPEVKKGLVDTMEYHINRSLEINPTYGAALIMKAAVAAARLEQDHQLDKFFHQIESVMEIIPYNSNFRDFMAKYMVYLNGSNSDKYISFCYRAGYEFYFLKKKDVKGAEEYLQYAVDRQTEDVRILEAMADVCEAAGKKEKAAEMRARAAAQK
jgi:protein O-mannosyl-transferase